ncbi:MAG: hypothetical protein KBT36_06375 [Kurthia sp.]|nr:hypothetical protein [Candidatus Kurthia equi]
MGNKKTSLLLAGLAAGAYAYLRKPENRDKALEAFNSTKAKVNDFVETQKQNIQKTVNDKKNDINGAGTTDEHTVTGDVEKDYHLDEKEMVSEGALTSVQYYNDEAQDRLDTKERNYFIDDKNMVSEGGLTKVQYENDTQQKEQENK